MPGVYVSYPFCAQKCTFCNFASDVFPRATEAHYLEALEREISSHRWGWNPQTVYLGGGTPGAMDSSALARLLSFIPGRPWKEATIEAAPGLVTPERARAWAAAGIGRVSLGVQSFVQHEIRATGRKHSAETVASEVSALREAGIAEINIDLIAGLPHQTEASWRESLAWIERLAPPHVSVYMLEVDGDSRLGRELLAGGARYGAEQAPDDDLTATLYETAVERLAGMGIARYEISNFARPGRESLHNLKYWLFEPYRGFGADAHSFDGHMRRANPKGLDDYLAGAEATEEPAAPDEEHFFVGLRLMAGVRPSAAEWRRFEAPIRRFLDERLLELEDGVLRLTARGVLLSNEVFQEFVCP